MVKLNLDNAINQLSVCCDVDKPSSLRAHIAKTPILY